MSIPNLTKKQNNAQVAIAHVIFFSQQYHNREVFPCYYLAFEEFVAERYQKDLRLAQEHWLGCNNKWEYDSNRPGEGKSKLFWINDHDVYFELLGQELPKAIKAKYEAKRKQRMIKVDNLINKKLRGQAKINAMKTRAFFNTITSKKFIEKNAEHLNRFEVYFLKALALHGMFLTVKLGRMYSSVVNIPSSLRDKLFHLAGATEGYDMISANLKFLGMKFEDNAFLDFMRKNDIYSIIGSNPKVREETIRMNEERITSPSSGGSSSSPSLYSALISQLPTKIGKTEEILPIRDLGKLAVQYLLNSTNCPLIHILKPIFSDLGFASFFQNLLDLKKSERAQGRKGIIVPCQELEDSVMREGIASFLTEKGYDYYDVHDECRTNAPEEVFIAAVREVSKSLHLNLVPEDFKHNGQQITSLPNEKPSKAPKQIEAVLTPPKDFQASDGLLMAPRTSPEDFLKPLESLLLPPNPFLFQALDDFMNEIGLELNHIPEHAILEQEEHLCRR